MATPNNATTSSHAPSGSSLQEDLAYYKSQYEQLELELQEFQASSRELEAELEKDIDASEKRERQLKEKVEDLKFEVEEWKVRSIATEATCFTCFLCSAAVSFFIEAYLFVDEIQTIQGRSRQCSKYFTKGDNHSERHKQNAPTTIEGYRSCKRRFRTPGTKYDVLARRPGFEV